MPIPPELAVSLHEHIAEFGTAPDGRLFPGERAGELPRNTYMLVLLLAALYWFLLGG